MKEKSRIYKKKEVDFVNKYILKKLLIPLEDRLVLAWLLRDDKAPYIGGEGKGNNSTLCCQALQKYMYFPAFLLLRLSQKES